MLILASMKIEENLYFHRGMTFMPLLYALCELILVNFVGFKQIHRFKSGKYAKTSFVMTRTKLR